MGHRIDPHPLAALARSGHPHNRIGIWRGTNFGVRPPVVVMPDQSPPGSVTRFQGRSPNLLPDLAASLRRLLPKGPLLLLAALLYVRADFSPPLRCHLPLRGWLRPSLPLSLRGQGAMKGRYRALQRGLRACGFADIPTATPTRNKTKEVYVMLSIDLDSASLAPDACAIATALAPQRLSITTATEIASVPGTPTPQPITGSALLSQHLAVNRPLPWGSA
jgi:hypothetical protein